MRRTQLFKNNSNFEIAKLFQHLYCEGKIAAISKFESFFTEWSCSYFVFALSYASALKVKTYTVSCVSIANIRSASLRHYVTILYTVISLNR